MSKLIGHNRGPSLEPVTWRAHCWRQARASLLPNLPIEVVRTRVKRAKMLGLDYKTYAGVRATTGRDLVAFLFSSNALNVFRDDMPIDPGRIEKLMQIKVDRHLTVSPGINLQALAQKISATSAQKLPPFASDWGAMRDSAKTWLHQQGLPGDAVLMIGETDHEREFMAAGGLAGFVSGMTYFAGQSSAT